MRKRKYTIGSYKDYDAEKHKDYVYFAEDIKVIYFNGRQYGLDLLSDESKHIEDITEEDHKLTIKLTNGKIEVIKLKDGRAYWEELPSLEKLYPLGGLILTLNNTNKFRFKPSLNNSGDYKTSDGQEGKYEAGKYITINFDEVGDHQVKLITNSHSGSTGIEDITANSLKDVKVVSGEYGPNDYKGTSGCKLSFFGDITSIGNYAFAYCSGFTGELKLPEGVTKIGNSAFYRCSGFTGKLVLPEGLTSIGIYAFSDCKGLTGELILPDSLTSIRRYAFESCTGLSKIYVCEDTELGNDWNDETPAEVIKYKKGETPWKEDK